MSSTSFAQPSPDPHPAAHRRAASSTASAANINSGGDRHWPRSQPRFLRPGARWWQAAAPTPLPSPRWLAFNSTHAHALGLPPAWAQQPAALQVLAGRDHWPGATPAASPYGGHQFGRWVPQLGDGRAMLVAELSDLDQQVQEVQLKGAGATPFARGGDGRALCRSSIREYLACEAMHALGVPTTRALALVGSDATVHREGLAHPEPIAVLTRTAPSFVRFGHFEYFAHQQDSSSLCALADHLIEHHHPQWQGDRDRHVHWLQEVIDRTARLTAQWQTLGFCHGVMNTDNASILGLTLDYGPFGFMDRFRPWHVANSSDHEGRYAWTSQPQAAQWNCDRLSEACASLLPPEARTELAHRFAPAYHAAVMNRWRAKLGLRAEHPDDGALLNRLLTLMRNGRCDFTLTFRALAWVAPSGHGLRERFGDPIAFDAWVADYQQRLAWEGPQERSTQRARAQRMRRVNPLFVLRNHLAHHVAEHALQGDLHPFQTLLRVLQRPFDPQPGMDFWARPPRADQATLEVSCAA